MNDCKEVRKVKISSKGGKSHKDLKAVRYNDGGFYTVQLWYGNQFSKVYSKPIAFSQMKAMDLLCCTSKNE